MAYGQTQIESALVSIMKANKCMSDHELCLQARVRINKNSHFQAKLKDINHAIGNLCRRGYIELFTAEAMDTDIHVDTKRRYIYKP